MLLFSSITFSAEEIIRALSWTLVHSLWQGIFLSFIAGAIIVLTKKSNSLLRYNLLTAALFLFVAGVAATFITQLVHATEAVQASVMPVSQISIAEPSAALVTDKTELSIIDKAVIFLNANANWIVLTWLLIIGYKFMRLSYGFYEIYQLKRREVSSPGEYWNNRMKELCQQLQVNQKVQLLQSHIIRIPAVIGYFKPVILFPVAMLTSMPVHEVEAVLIHELGHIRRKDFLVNMLQNITEIIFFFNPAILWVSSLIKTERENCCDDIAVTHTANKQDYIKALVTFQQFSQPATQQLATAFAGEKNHLLSRVKRIVYNNNKTLNNMEKKFLSASLILVSVCLFAFVSNKAQDDKKEKTTSLQTIPVSNTETTTPASDKLGSKKGETFNLKPVSTHNIVETSNPATVSVAMDTIPVYKSEVLQAKDKQEKPDADTSGKNAAEHNPKDENVHKITNRTGIYFGDDSLIAYVNEKQISKIDRKKSKEEIEDWIKKYAPLTGVDLNSLDKSYYAQTVARTQRIQRIQPISPTQPIPPFGIKAAPIEPVKRLVENTNSSNFGLKSPSFTGIDIDEKLAVAYKNGKEISRITSKNSKAEIEKWRDDIEKLLNTKFPSIQQNLIDKKKE